LRPRVSRERVAELTSLLRREVKPFLPQLVHELSPEKVTARLADVDALEPGALVFYAADLAVETPWSSDQKSRRNDLVVKVRNHDAVLSGWASPAFRNDKDATRVLADITRGRGIRDDADDTIRLVALFRKYWAKVEKMTPLTTQALDIAESEATELLRLLDDGEAPAKGSPRDLRRRAYTMWYRAYAEIMHLGRYLARNDPDAVKRFPSASPERVNGGGTEEDVPNSGATPAPPAPPAPPTATPK